MNLPFLRRASGIRTHDPLHPMQVRYQTALLPEDFLFCLSCAVERVDEEIIHEFLLLSIHFFHDIIFFVMKKVKIAVVGASGYTGQELLRILLRHSGVELVCATSRQYAGQELCDLFPRFRNVPGADLKFTDSDVAAIAATGAEAAFLALPHGVSAAYGRGLVEAGIRVIDLSADFRLNDPAVYEEFYGKPHPDVELMQEAVYGMPEWHRAEIEKARIVGSPGCYPTSIILPLVPLLKAGLIKSEDIVVNSGSGVSGAGRKADVTLLYCECNESMRAYGVPRHRHLSEIEQELSEAAGQQVVITFTPHLMPVNTGIVTTTVAKLADGVTADDISACMQKAYADAPFVRLMGLNKPADTKNVTRTNFVDIGWAIDARTNRLVLMSAEDNVIKGAGGQGVHAFNIMFGFDETEGLWLI